MIEIYSTETCYWCQRVKAFLTGRGLLFQEFIVGKDISKEDFLAKFNGTKLVPQVIIGGKYIGGCEETENYFKAMAVENESN